MSDTFTLDPRLEADSLSLVDMPLSSVRLINDARFPWLVLVPRKPGLSEIIDLEPQERALLMEEIALAAHALRAVTGCDKLNVGALGNVVRQLHVHVVARFEGDLAWDGPVWGAGKAEPYEPDAREQLSAEILSQLQAGVQA